MIIYEIIHDNCVIKYTSKYIWKYLKIIKMSMSAIYYVNHFDLGHT